MPTFSAYSALTMPLEAVITAISVVQVLSLRINPQKKKEPTMEHIICRAYKSLSCYTNESLIAEMLLVSVTKVCSMNLGFSCFQCCSLAKSTHSLYKSAKEGVGALSSISAINHEMVPMSCLPVTQCPQSKKIGEQ